MCILPKCTQMSTLSLPSLKMFILPMYEWGSENLLYNHLSSISELWKVKFFILCHVVFLVRLQGKFEVGHLWINWVVFCFRCMIYSSPCRFKLAMYQVVNIDLWYIFWDFLQKWGHRYWGEMSFLQRHTVCNTTKGFSSFALYGKYTWQGFCSLLQEWPSLLWSNLKQLPEQPVKKSRTSMGIEPMMIEHSTNMKVMDFDFHWSRILSSPAPLAVSHNYVISFCSFLERNCPCINEPSAITSRSSEISTLSSSVM